MRRKVTTPGSAAYDTETSVRSSGSRFFSVRYRLLRNSSCPNGCSDKFFDINFANNFGLHSTAEAFLLPTHQPRVRIEPIYLVLSDWLLKCSYQWRQELSTTKCCNLLHFCLSFPKSWVKSFWSRFISIRLGKINCDISAQTVTLFSVYKIIFLNLGSIPRIYVTW